LAFNERARAALLDANPSSRTLQVIDIGHYSRTI
jgi:hypothetical protein